jgi:hypothetical protein
MSKMSNEAIDECWLQERPATYDHVNQADLPRSEIVSARLARNVGPLFGVPNPEGPLGDISWVSDYETLTLLEIGRGAPLPYKRDRGAVSDEELTDNTFVIRDRAVHGTPPEVIKNPTLHSFGPNTKGAVILAGINQLLKPIFIDLAEETRWLAFRELPPHDKLRAYGAMIVGTFIPQPFLFDAGLRARAIQRAHVGWQLPASPALNNVHFTSCEIATTTKTDPPRRMPLDLHIVDRLLEVAGLQHLPWNPYTVMDRSLITAPLINLLRPIGHGGMSRIAVEAQGDCLTARGVIEDPSELLDAYTDRVGWHLRRT